MTSTIKHFKKVHHRKYYIFICMLLAATSTLATEKPETDNDTPVEVLTTAPIFKPIIADPKWPRFTLAYYFHSKGSYGNRIFAPSFGAALPLAKKTTDGITYELGIHAGLFAVMDIGSNPTRLINADYFIGPTLALKQEHLDCLIRISHLSSHLGDEFLLSKQGKNIKRINLSYETAEVLAAYNFANGFRPVVGIGYIFHAEPQNYKTLELTMGLDYRGLNYFLGNTARPIIGIYSKTSNNFGWHPNISIKGGVEFKNHKIAGKALQLLIEYYNGNSLQGQFYKRHEHYLGTSINLEF